MKPTELPPKTDYPITVLSPQLRQEVDDIPTDDHYQLTEAFEQKRGLRYDLFTVAWFDDEVLCALTDLQDIKAGTYDGRGEPDYIRYCCSIITEEREKIIKLTEDDTYFNLRIKGDTHLQNYLRNLGHGEIVDKALASSN